MVEYQIPEILEAVAGGEGSGAGPLSVRLLYGLLNQQSRSMPRKLDYEEPCRQEVPFCPQLRLSRHPLYVYVLGSDLEAPEEVQGLIGLTTNKQGLCQSPDAELAFTFAWQES